MNGQMRKYKESLRNTPGPVNMTDRTSVIDIPAIVRYAREKNVSLAELSEDERAMFIVKKH